MAGVTVVSMVVPMVVPMACAQDVEKLECQLRELYKVEECVQCQALLTTEYRVFKYTLLKGWRRKNGQTQGQTQGQTLADAVGEVEAFLPGWHLRFANQACEIKAIAPLIPRGAQRKRARAE